MFKVGQKILVCSDLDDPRALREKVIESMTVDTVKCGKEDYYYTAYCWPIKYKNELISILEQRKQLKQLYNDSMKLVYELKNKIYRDNEKAQGK